MTEQNSAQELADSLEFIEVTRTNADGSISVYKVY